MGSLKIHSFLVGKIGIYASFSHHTHFHELFENSLKCCVCYSHCTSLSVWHLVDVQESFVGKKNVARSDFKVYYTWIFYAGIRGSTKPQTRENANLLFY